MTEHAHTKYVEGCFRCDLSRDEVDDIDVSEPRVLARPEVNEPVYALIRQANQSADVNALVWRAVTAAIEAATPYLVAEVVQERDELLAAAEEGLALVQAQAATIKQLQSQLAQPNRLHGGITEDLPGGRERNPE